MMKRLLATLLTLCVVFSARTAWADDVCVTEAKATPESTCVVMERNGVRGTWMTLPVVGKFQRAAIELRAANVDLSRYQELVTLRDNQVALQDQAIESRKAEVDRLNAALKGQQDHTAEMAADLQKAEQKAATAKIVWLVVGVVVGGAATFGGYEVLHTVGVIK